MKLHRVEVTNLASLYGTQTLDLDADLGGASLFLIQGPTGSGKSTLLDGVSLALFGTTPRLGAKAQREAVAAALMSRGASESRAELEFSTNTPTGASRWRATWKAWRARGRPDGDIQPVHRSLEEHVDGRWVVRTSDHRAREYGPAFERALDRFTVDDFCRSMLLAQGQFDAFLRAGEDERAAILERLTDTAEYTELGRRAARLRKAWDGRLRRLAQALETIDGVPPDREAAARQEAEHLTAELEANTASAGQLQGARGWLVEALARRGAVGSARAASEAVEEELRAHAEDLEALARHEALGRAFAAADEEARRVAEAEELERRVAATEAQVPGRTLVVRDAQEEALRADTRARAEADGLEALRQPVEQTTLAMQEAEQARLESERAGVTLERAGVARAAAEEQARQRAEESTAAEATHRRLTEQRAADLVGPRLAAAMTGLQARAGTARERSRALEQLRRAIVEEDLRLAEEAARILVDRERLAARVAEELPGPRQRASAARERLAALVEAATGEAPGEDLDAAVDQGRARLGEAALEASDRRARAERTARAVGRWVEAAARAAEAGRTADTAQRQLPVLLERCRRLEEAARTARAVRDAQVRTRDRAVLAANLVEHRSALEDGEPCPLCGSREHPVVDDPLVRERDTAERALLRTIRTDAENAERACAEAERTVLGAETARKLAEREAERAGDLRDRAEVQAEAAAREAADTTRPEPGALPGGHALSVDSFGGAPDGQASRLPDGATTGLGASPAPRAPRVPTEASTPFDGLPEGSEAAAGLHPPTAAEVRATAAGERARQELDAAQRALEAVRASAARLSDAAAERRSADAALRAACEALEAVEAALAQRLVALDARRAALSADRTRLARLTEEAEEAAQAVAGALAEVAPSQEGGWEEQLREAGRRLSAWEALERAVAAAVTALAESRARAEGAERRAHEARNAEAQARSEAQARAEAEASAVERAAEAGRVLAACWERIRETTARLVTGEAEPQAPVVAELAPRELLRSQEDRVRAATEAARAAGESRSRAEAELSGVRERLGELRGLATAARMRAREATLLLLGVLEELGLAPAAAPRPGPLFATLADAGREADETERLALGRAALTRARLPEEQAVRLRSRRTELEERRAATRAVLSERERHLGAHLAACEPAWPALLTVDGEGGPAPGAESGSAPWATEPDGAAAVDILARLDAELARLTTDRARLEEARHAALQVLRRAEAGHEARRTAEQRLEEGMSLARPWLALHELVGKGDGRAFRIAAQALNLAQVLDRANLHLARLHERYRLVGREEAGAPTLDLLVEDRWQQDTLRKLETLSGGETFLVSLALALGLADLRRVRLRIETLLLDEGFGTLDADTLDTALDALARLQATGLQVGVISHVQGLQERFFARVLVVPRGGGRSVLEIGR